MEGGLQKMCEIKMVWALRGRRRVDCETKCEIKRDGQRLDCEKNVRN